MQFCLFHSLYPYNYTVVYRVSQLDERQKRNANYVIELTLQDERMEISSKIKLNSNFKGSGVQISRS